MTDLEPMTDEQLQSLRRRGLFGKHWDPTEFFAVSVTVPVIVSPRTGRGRVVCPVCLNTSPTEEFIREADGKLRTPEYCFHYDRANTDEATGRVVSVVFSFPHERARIARLAEMFPGGVAAYVPK